MAALLHPSNHIAAASSHAEGSRSRNRLRAILAGLLALNLALAAMALRSPGRTEEQRRSDLAQLEEQHREALRTVQRLRQLKQKVQDATANEQAFARANFLPRNSAFSQMLADLERLASANRLQPGDVTYSLTEPDNQLGWVGVDVTLSVEGDYPDLVRFLNQLERSELFWIVKRLAVTSQAGQRLRLSLQAGTYLLPS